MARQFLERQNATTINGFDRPFEFDKTSGETRIAELQDILDEPSYIKTLMIAGIMGIGTEAEFDEIHEDELGNLADLADFYDTQTVTTVESFDAIDHRWMSPSAMALGAGTIVSVCGEEVGNEAIQAIDGVAAQNWQHDFDHQHEIVFDLGYVKRIDGIRVKNTASPGGPFQLSGVQVYTAANLGVIDDAASHVGVDLEFTDGGDNDRDLTIRNARYVKLEIGSTGHVDNHITVRDIELRTKPRLAALL